MTNFLKIGHRGACGYEPENTLLSFQRALDLGANGIELDVHRCASGEIVVIHDDALERTTDGFGKVSETVLAELKLLDAGDGEKIPTLEEVLDLVRRRAVMLIELKDTNSAEAVAKIVTQYVEKKDWSYDNFMVIGFNHHELVKVAAVNPKIPLGATLCAIPINYAEIATLAGAKAINPSKDFVDARFVADAHKRGLKVFVWTANKPEDITRIKALGVDGIISDFPDRL